MLGSNFNRYGHGSIISNLLQKSDEGVNGITGRISFNELFQRTYFTMEIIEHTPGESMKKIATWDPDNKIINLRTTEEVTAQISQSLQNKTLIVTTRTGMPYMRIK